MTDWSVERKTCLVAISRAPKGLQRTVRALIKMLLQEASATQPLARTVQRFIGNDQERAPGGEPVDELIQVFLAVRNQLNQQSLPAQQYLEKLGRALQEVAVENGVEPLRFYHGLLARILEEATGRAQDVEFGFTEDGALVVFQARRVVARTGR